MSVACSQLRRKNVSSHLNLEFVSEDKYWLCLSVSIETDENTRCDKKWLDWINEDSYFV